MTGRAADAAIAREGDALVFRGALDRAAVPALWAAARPLLEDVARFDLAAVTAVDSAGVALLSELADTRPAVVVEGDPPGLDALRAAYRLGPDLHFGR